MNAPEDVANPAVKPASSTVESSKIWLRFRIAFEAALVLLVVTVALAIKVSHDSVTARQWVNHTHEVIECLTEVDERAVSRELALRNFLRSGDNAFRDRYFALDTAVQSLADRLVSLVVDNPLQTKRANQLQQLMDDRHHELYTIVTEYKPENAQNILAGNVERSSALQGVMDAAMLTFRAEEQRLLGERQARLERSFAFIELLVPGMGVTGLLVLLGCQIALGRYMEQTRRAHAEVQAARRTADEANAFKSAFLANVSHEIRTPLAAVLGYTDMLRTGEIPSVKERDECLRIIRRNGEQVLTIVNDILDLSKIEAGRMTTERIPCDVIEVVGDVASLFRRVAADRGLSFEVKYIDPIPEQVRSDPTRLRQVLMNLVGNAVKFTERGGVRLVVDLVRENGLPAMMRFRVIDTGIGISKETAATLFQPFIQGDVSTTRRFGGTGLGLTISRHFAELLGGGIAVESVMGTGSTFTLTVAAGDLAGVRMLLGVEEASRGLDHSTFVTAPRLNGRRILVAEDGVDNQQIILFHLRQSGADVTLAENGKAAVQLAIESTEANRPFDLILMDMQMPVMDGYKATTILRDRRYTGTIVALTANAMAHDRQKCLTAGCNGFITKPIHWPAFWETIRRYVTEATEGAADVRAGPAKADLPADVVEETKAPSDNLNRLVAKFSAALPDRVAEIRAAFERKDRDKMKLMAHSLAGASSSYGFPEQGEIARQIDLNYAADDNQLSELLRALDASVFRSLAGRAA